MKFWKNRSILKICIWFLALFLSILFFASPFISEEPTAPAPLPAARSDIYTYYKLAWLDDGYPGRRTKQGIVAHPLYGTYVIIDYLNEWRRTKDKQYLDAAVSVAEAGLARMQPFKGALVFFYDPSSGLTGFNDRFYSALTQARWLYAMDKLYKATKQEKFKKASEHILKSFTIPTNEGGVLQTVGGGASIEEYPHIVPIYTLNGWLTALNVLVNHAQLTGDKLAEQLIEKNLIALRKLLPLYDLPELHNSRYQLTGTARFRLKGPSIEKVQVDIPEVGLIEVKKGEQQQSKWDNVLLTENGKSELRVTLSYATSPKPNRLILTTKTNAPIEIEIGISEYNPSVTALPVSRWQEIGTFQPHKNKVIIPIPWKHAYLVAYPTAFTKKIGDEYYNIYHNIHIQELLKLYKSTNIEEFKYYAEKWKSYYNKWPQDDRYIQKERSLKPYNSKVKN